ncbi:MAG: RnfH family protein [Gammaproteobacteria bacterium]|nr:RnfH family protein [Gammaproteobacteria bacterium]
MADGAIRIEVACALPGRQRLIALNVSAGTNAREALALSQLQAEFPELDFERLPLAVYGELVADDYLLQPGDRVEVCRPLARDPREVRRELAERGLTMAGGAARRRRD